MSNIVSLLAIPGIRSWYVIFCFAVMLLPMIGLTIWYHRRINSTLGGRTLMDRQNRSHLSSRGSIWGAAEGFRDASSMMRDIKQGRYGADAKGMQTVVYWFVGLWLIANFVCFGILIWADELNK